MQRKIWFLSTCDTCQRIMREVGVDDSFEQQDIKFNPLTEEQLETLYRYAGKYEELVNKRARKLKEALVSHPVNDDADYRKLLLMDYTFLKRPVFVINGKLFAGNAKQTVEAVSLALKK